MVVSRSAYMVRHTRGNYRVYTHCCLWKRPRQKTDQVIGRCHPYASPRQKRFSVKSAAHPSCASPSTSRRFVLGASNVCLVGENPTCSVPALWGCEALCSYDYSHACHEYTTPFSWRRRCLSTLCWLTALLYSFQPRQYAVSNNRHLLWCPSTRL